ncbi:hypothetical protein WMY93_017698 [Mugilogobius chulae]|uniref:RING-type domain-containing protein n=1 Tax=Mugilogobius chulae TaxID=88201 RepID=A0AAW0NW50_9GOBI
MAAYEKQNRIIAGQRTEMTCHYLKATALTKASRTDEALQEYFHCVALKPDWTKVKLEAQKVLSDLFSSVFEREDMPHLCILSRRTGTRLIKPAALLGSLRAPRTTLLRPSSKTHSWVVGLQDGPSSSKSLASVLAALPGTPGGLKRKHNGEGPSGAPAKFLKPEGGVQTVAVCGGRLVPAELLDSGDLECSLCMRLFYEPVTTPCGHTFCLKCLERCLDHNPNCPLCKENLSEFLANRGYNKTLLMEEVLQRYLGDELEDRRKIHEEEMKELSNLNQEVPIFVCTMAFPTIPAPARVRAALQADDPQVHGDGHQAVRHVHRDDLKGFADYGCMLQVRDVKFFPDGRSVVDTIGVSRFKVLSHGQRDGYHTAKIEYLEDKKVEGEELVELLKLHDAVYEQANSWFTSLRDNMKSQILSHFGQLPSKDPDPSASPRVRPGAGGSWPSCLWRTGPSSPSWP